jgi:hypothetical protein
MSTLFTLLRRCQDFGIEYELLCTQLSIQSSRIRLWGESVRHLTHFDPATFLTDISQVDLQIDVDNRLQDGIFERPEVQETVNQTVNSIAYLVTEIEVIRQKYELRPRLALIPEFSADDAKSGRARPPSSSSPAPLSVRQRMEDNQKQKSYLAITKWAIRDAKKFDEKVKQLKSLVDGLEDVTRAANFTRSRQPRVASSSTSLRENPPPYAEFDQPAPGYASGPRRPTVTPIPRTTPNISRIRDVEILEHYHTLKLFLNGSNTIDICPRPPCRAREKLPQLSDVQLKELRTDIYDDLIRRQQHGSILSHLPPIRSFHPKRNQARFKLSTLLPHRFRDLAEDVMLELERRFPELKEQFGHLANVTCPFSAPRPDTTRRHGCVLPNGVPPPLLHYRPMHPTALAQVASRRPDIQWPLPATRISQTSTALGQVNGPTASSSHPRRACSSSQGLATSPRSEVTPTGVTPPPSAETRTSNTTSKVEAFKSFRVSMDDPCHKVLPAALKKYNINAPWESYALYIIYGDKERCLGLDEKPLILFKQLDKEGKKPMFMLRKIAVAANIARASTSASGPSSDPTGGQV